MVITGYRIPSNNLNVVMDEIRKARNKINNIATKEYHKLLGEKIAFIFDNIAIGVYTRNPGGVIFNDAVSALKQEMDAAFHLGTENNYNFQIYLHIIPSENETYLKVTCPNHRFLSAFSHIEDYSLTEDESQNKWNAKTVKWVKLCEESQKNEPASLNLTPYPAPDPEKVKYPSMSERCEKMAQQNLLNHYMNQISGGGQIQPALLMEYLGRAMDMLVSQAGQTELAQKKMNLGQILQDLEAHSELVTEPYDPSKEMPSNNQAESADGAEAEAADVAVEEIPAGSTDD